MRSKNHTLYEISLEAMGEKELYENTRKYNLGLIVTYTQIVDDVDWGDSLSIINGIRWNRGFPGADNFEDINDSDLSNLSTIKEIHELGEPELLTEAVRRIDEYHEKKRNR